MPRFFFHLRTETVLELDRTGLDYPDIESAYLEACRSVPGLAAEFIAAGRDPMNFQFEIMRGDGQSMMEVPFREMVRARPG